MANKQIPFKYDMVGSFLRPEHLKNARNDHIDGKISKDELTAVENECIDALVKKLVDLGYQDVTDGEYRRGWYHSDFYGELEGIKLTTYKMDLFGTESLVGSTTIEGQIRWNENHPFVEHFRYFKKLADGYGVTAKLDIPGPNMVFVDTMTTEQDHYYNKDLRRMSADFVEVYRNAIKTFYAEGCRYLQFDDPVWCCLVDPGFSKKITDAGYDIEEVKAIFQETTEKILEVKPADMAITLHICQGNMRSLKFYDTTYENIASTLFKLDYDGFFMEFDEEKYCNFEFLSQLDKDKKIVLGLVCTQYSELEDKAVLLDRIERAKKYCDASQICVATQCGFASTVEGNIITEEAQWEKMKLVKELGESV